MRKVQDFANFSDTSEARNDLRGSALRAFSSVLGSSAVEFVVRIASTAVLARLISPEHFGLFLMAAVVTSVADQFRDLGLSTATIQREKITHHEVSNLFWLNLGAGLVMTLIVCAVAPFAASYYHEPRLTLVIILLSSSIALGGATVQHEALLARQLKHGRKALVRLLAFVLSTVFAVFMAYAGFGFWSLIWREVLRAALIAVGVWWVCPWIPGAPDRKTDVRGLLGFGANLTLTYFLNVLSSCFDRLLIGRFFGPEPVALYRQPYQLVVAPMSQFMGPLYQVVLPGMSMLQDEPVRFRRFYRKVVSVVALLSMPLSVFLAVYAHEFTIIILGPKWEAATPYLLIFALGGVLRSVASTIGFVLVSRGHSSILLRVGVVQCLVMFLLMAGGLWWGPQGVAIGEGLTSVVMLLPWAYFSFRGSSVSIRDFLGALARPAASALFLGLVLLAFGQLAPFHSPSLAISFGTVVAAFALALAWLVIPGGPAEIKELSADILSRFRRKAVVVRPDSPLS